jgi:hypothetical protein
MGRSAGGRSAGNTQGYNQMGGRPSQLPSMGGGYQGLGSSPGGMSQGRGGPLGQSIPQLQDWRAQLQNHQPGGMDKWEQWMERQRPQYSGGNATQGRFRGGMGRRPITNAGSYTGAQAGQGGPGDEITAPAAVAGAPNPGGGVGTPGQGGGQSGGQASGQSGGQQGSSSQDIIQALRARFGSQGR